MFYETKKFKKTGFAVMIVAVPIIAVMLSWLVVSHVHDVYEYDMDHHKAIEKMELGVDASRLANNISSYLTGDTDVVRTFYKDDADYDEGIEYDVMTEADYSHLDEIVHLGNLMKLLSIIGIIVYAAFLFLSTRANDYVYKGKLRKAFIIGSLITLLILAAAVAYSFSSGFSGLVESIGIGFGHEGLLGRLMGNRVIAEITRFAAIIGLAIDAVLMWITWQCTKPRRMF